VINEVASPFAKPVYIPNKSTQVDQLPIAESPLSTLKPPATIHMLDGNELVVALHKHVDHQKVTRSPLPLIPTPVRTQHIDIPLTSHLK
jgi:hypothetical protein